MVGVLLILAVLGLEEPETGKATYEQAQALYNQGRFQDALPLFERAYELSGGRPAATFGLAQCHRALGRYDEALEFFRAYAQLDLPESEAKRVAQTIAEIEELQREAAPKEPALAAVEAPPLPSPSPAALVSDPPPEASKGFGVAKIVVGSTGLAAALGGVVLGQTALSEARRNGADDGLVTRGEIADALIISGAVVMVGTIVWWLVERQSGT